MAQLPLPNPRYPYSKLTAQELIDQAYMYIGVLPADQDVKKAKIALNALNEILYKWINKGILQYNEVTLPIKLQNEVVAYQLPENIYDIYDVTVASVGRQRIGTPFSSSGVASNAFDENILTSCVQTSPNGNLGILFTIDPINQPTIPVINYVGVLSGTTTDYKLVIEGSDDNVNYIPLETDVRTQPFNGSPSISNIVWYNINTPRPYTYLRIRETNGGTLNIRELYFESQVNSRYITGIGRSEYMQYAMKMNPGTPSLFCMYKNNNNIVLNLYGVPTQLPLIQDYTPQMPFYNFLVCRGVSLTMSITYLNNPVDLNPRFIGAIRSELSAQLALIYMPDKAQMLKAEAAEAFMNALTNDNDGGKLKFQLNNYRVR